MPGVARVKSIHTRTELHRVLQDNIQALIESRRDMESRIGLQERFAAALAQFAGSMPFVYIHVLICGGWLGINSGWIPVAEPFDPPPYTKLAMAASVEAIFLSTFVLINQNRIQRVADRRADLDVQISLLTEHELTRLITLVDAIAKRMEVTPPVPVEPLTTNVRPADVLREIEKADQAGYASKELDE